MGLGLFGALVRVLFRSVLRTLCLSPAGGFGGVPTALAVACFAGGVAFGWFAYGQCPRKAAKENLTSPIRMQGEANAAGKQPGRLQGKKSPI
jgi:hypothetical protein